MALPQVLLETVDNLIKKDLKRLKWIKPIHRELIETHGDEMAVNVTAEVLKKIGRDTDAKTLKNRYAAGGDTAAPSTSTSAAALPAAPAAPVATDAAPVATDASPVATDASPVATDASPVANPAALAAMMAQEGSIIIAPTVTGGTTGTWNITINK